MVRLGLSSRRQESQHISKPLWLHNARALYESKSHWRLGTFPHRRAAIQNVTNTHLSLMFLIQLVAFAKSFPANLIRRSADLWLVPTCSDAGRFFQPQATVLNPDQAPETQIGYAPQIFVTELDGQ